MTLQWESVLAVRGNIYLCQESVLLKPRQCSASTIATVADLSAQPDSIVLRIPSATPRSAVPYFWLIQYGCITVDFLGWSFCREAESPSFQLTSKEVTPIRQPTSDPGPDVSSLTPDCPVLRSPVPSTCPATCSR